MVVRTAGIPTLHGSDVQVVSQLMGGRHGLHTAFVSCSPVEWATTLLRFQAPLRTFLHLGCKDIHESSEGNQETTELTFLP